MRKASLNIILSDLCTSLMVLLFTYAGASKLLQQDVFRIQLINVPVIKKYRDIFALTLPIFELLLAVLMIVKHTRVAGLVVSLVTLCIFIAYLSISLLTNSDLPCHCGGVINSLSWKQHIFFNLFFIVVATFGLYTQRSVKLSAKSSGRKNSYQ
ncbi:MAG: hypothetical protein J0H29_02015 [Sphingobacteriales bacterium]|nr:hypothetical protein [Sphingobacteriales bacterium]OJY88028.1 MAG: hypothetical protein BGP14_21560 [Sphingobacteriales bacterium 44-15]